MTFSIVRAPKYYVMYRTADQGVVRRNRRNFRDFRILAFGGLYVRPPRQPDSKEVTVWSEKSPFATYHIAGTSKFSFTAP